MMQAAFISYAVFLALLLLLVLVVFVVIAVKSLRAYIRGGRVTKQDRDNG
jgi:hypothetical protein